MTALTCTYKLTTTTWMTPNGLPKEEVVPLVQVTPWDGKVYRLLRHNEHAENGIFAKSTSSNVTAAFHVAWGSSKYKKDSKYISTCLTYDNALSMSKKNRYLNGDIVSINVDHAPVTVIHVRDEYVRQQLILQENIASTDTDTISRFYSFANANNEIILVGPVPNNCVTIITR